MSVLEKAAKEAKAVTKETLRAGHVVGSRIMSNEASTSASSSDACFKDFQLIEIPDVMDRVLNAPQGAALMRRWFNSPAFSLPESWRDSNVNYMAVPANHIDSTIIKMHWAAAFPRVRVKLNYLEQQLVKTPAAARELKRVLQRQGLIKQSRLPVGLSTDAIVLHETAHLNSAGVDFGQTVDALDCALASFTLHMAVSGFVQPISATKVNVTHEVEILKLHFYLRDSYDFTTDKEQLGFWDRDGASAALYDLNRVFVETERSGSGVGGMEGEATSWCFPMS
jgi:hypothetical protein